MPSEISFEYADINSLIPYALNSRTHSDEQVAQIAASIREFGFLIPVLTDSNGGLIAGHGRILAARKLGLVKIPVVVADGLTETQKKAYVIADNQLALNAGWVEKEDCLDQSGDACVPGDAWVYGNARVSGDAHWIGIGPIGSENGFLTAFRQKDNTIMVSRGCFSGTIDEFESAVNERHGDSKYGEEYRALIPFIKLRLDEVEGGTNRALPTQTRARCEA